LIDFDYVGDFTKMLQVSSHQFKTAVVLHAVCILMLMRHILERADASTDFDASTGLLRDDNEWSEWESIH